MKKIFILLLLNLLGITCINAQNTLNIHCKSGGVVSYIFSQKPKVTYTADNLHISTLTVEVDYPLSDVHKFTFSNTADGVESIKMSGNTDAGQTKIYTINGTLIKTIDDYNGRSEFYISELPRGIYVIKNNTIQYKVIKR